MSSLKTFVTFCEIRYFKNNFIPVLRINITQKYGLFTGDLFDEGKWCPQKEFNDYVERFNKYFQVPEGTSIYTVAGNHDIGFHYR